MNGKGFFAWMFIWAAMVFATVPTYLHAENPYSTLENHEVTESDIGDSGKSVSADATATSTAQLDQIVRSLERLINEYEKLLAKLEAGPSQSESPNSDTSGEVDTSMHLNVRVTPYGRIIGKLAHGDKVRIIAKEGDWYKILFGDGHAYVHSDYVSAPGFESDQDAATESQPSSDPDVASDTPDPSDTPTAPDSQTSPEPQTSSEQVTYGLKGTAVSTYDSDTLKISVEKVSHSGTTCYVSKVWVKDPTVQLTKCAAKWRKNLQRPSALAKQNSKVVLAVNGSGFYNSSWHSVPHAYGSDSSNYCTSAGSIVIINGKIMRNVSKVPFTGIAITPGKGLTGYFEASTSNVLADKANNTFAFEIHSKRKKFIYFDGKSCSCDFTGISARTVFVKVNYNNFYIITVKGASGSAGLGPSALKSLIRKMGACQWAYNTDGGGSTTLLAKPSRSGKLKRIYGDGRSIGEIFCVTER